MRPQQNRRVRGRNNNNSNNNNNRRGPNPLSRNYESSGPDVKIRGNAQQIADKYISLARDAQGAGDRVMSENYLQHAEHYLRIILAAVGQTQYARRDENRDENNEQECSEINVEVEKKDTINCETDVAQTPLQKNGHGQYAQLQNGYVREEALQETVPLATVPSDEKELQEQCSGEETVEPVRKTRRTPRRRTARVQEGTSLEFPHFELPRATSEAAQDDNGMSMQKAASSPVLEKEIQRKPRRRRVVTSSAEENI
ncbi:DUF4167 domain-containing protein [Bartonella birtlesii]|uniref:DUF4167 domain-containing protein n=1 Tax=Bartonella birtlesii LL-WM9 TaxID=1094552 RepID=J0PVT8_9HYPH|nr:DUF4167 domain-containing protein [Bartonella birtlesii]EJF76751.1 hypothetical protein ME7_00783 [Bartonella birtlesii LL-WM9]